jgi:hypothetical protein
MLVTTGVVLGLAGCKDEGRGAIRPADTGNPDVSAFLLATVDGCRVWRLYDQSQGRYVYVSTCGASGSKAQWTEGCGKNCTRHVESLSPLPTMEATR